MIKPTKYQTISCSLEEDMIKKLDEIAKDFRMTRTGIIRLLLNEGIITYDTYIYKKRKESTK